MGRRVEFAHLSACVKSMREKFGVMVELHDATDRVQFTLNIAEFSTSA